MKHLIIVLILVVQLIAWETTTHRAIDKTAIESKSVVNLKKFVESVNIKNEDYSKEVFEGYTNKKTGKPITYFDYFNPKYSDDAMADWNQTFSKIKNYQDIIEAGTMLEDAVWPGAWSSGYGRFLNHFADPQNGYKGFSLGETDALLWAWGSSSGTNQYDYVSSLSYFKEGFTNKSIVERKKYQAKMFVSVGHILHLMNDMNVPAHTRDDAHPNGDALEWWARGGEDGTNANGFHVVGSSLNVSTPKMDNVSMYRFGDYHSEYFGELFGYMKKEAKFTGTHFFSGYAKYTWDVIDTIEKKALPAKYHEANCYVAVVPDVKQCYIVSDELTSHNKLAIRVKSYFYNRLGEYVHEDHTQMRGGDMTTFQGDMSVLEDNAWHLIPRAVANAEGFLNYFFRGQMEAEANPCGVKVTNISDASTVAGDDIVTFKKGGTLEVYYDNKAGERKMIGMKTLEKDLFVQDTVFVPVRFSKKEYDDMSDTKWIVVYDGYIGNEKGVSVKSVDIKDIKFPDIPKATNGAIEIYLSWNYECDINMDLDMQGPATEYDIKDIEFYGKEHAYVKSEFDIHPGDIYTFGTTGEALDSSMLDDEVLAKEPISVLALLDTPTGSYFKKWDIETLANLNIGEFAELQVKDQITTEWTEESEGGGSSGIIGRRGSNNRSYTQCEDKDSSCGCVPCEYVVTGMKKRVENGPIAGADVEIIKASDDGENNPNVIYKTKTTDKDDIFESGLIELSDDAKKAIDKDAYYIIRASGGKDIDYDDDMYRDVKPVENHGTIHAIIKGEDLVLMPFRINVLTEAIYQVSGDVIGNNYDAKALSSKLDSVSQKLISQKLYIKDENTTVRYADILLWTPAVDKRALYKPFDIFVKPIIDKLYANQPRYKESYTLIYDEYDTQAPQLKPQVLTLSQGLPNGTIVAKVSTTNQKSFSKIILEGKFNECFSVDEKGLIHIAQSEQIREGNVYHLQMYAIGDDGKEGAKVSLDISIDGVYEVAHPDKSVPMFEGINIYSLDENAPEKTKVADVYFSDKDASIVSYLISGYDADDFKVDKSGHITVASGANIDYEKRKIYSFNIQAINDVGNSSYPVKIEIPVNNLIDTPIFDQEIFEHIKENIPVGSVVTQIREDREGQGKVEKFEILSPNIPFRIDNNGTIIVDEPIDYEEKSSYDFYVIAVTAYGNSNKIEVNIIVDNQEPEEGIPYIQDIDLNVSENVSSETLIGTLSIDEGEGDIEKIEYSGSGKAYFTLDTKGNIYLAKDKKLDYEENTHLDLEVRALNSRGWSNKARVSINIVNIPDTPPTIDDTTLSIVENSLDGTTIGDVSVKDVGEGNITGFTLLGDGSDMFSIDDKGTIKVAGSLDYEKQNTYHLNVIAHSSLGDSNEADLYIKIEDVPDVVPVLNNTKLEVRENKSVGDEVGDINLINSGDTPIISYMLYGTDLFTIDNKGVITLAKDIVWSQTKSVDFNVTATNTYGTSMPIVVHVDILRVYYDGTSQADAFEGTQRDEYFDTKDGNDSISAGGGDDRLIGGKGNDYLAGGSGDDVYVYYRDDGNDTIEDSSGDDTLYLYAIDKNETVFILDSSDLVLKFDDNATIRIVNWVEDDYKIEHFIFEDGEVESSIFDIPMVKPDAAIADLSKLSNDNAAQVVQGWIVPLENGNLKVDHWIFDFDGGELMIDTLSELNSNGQDYIDIDGDGEQLGIDLYIYVFRKDSDGNWSYITCDDDSSQTYNDGSTHPYDSYLKLNLEAGEYMLAIGNYSLSSSAALNGENRAGYYGRGGAYQITFNHELEFIDIPSNANGDLYGSDHFNYYVLGNDIDPYNGNGLYIENPQIVDENGSIINKGYVESYGNFISFYPSDAFNDLNGSQEVNIVYDVVNQNQNICRSLLSIQVISSLYENQHPEVNSELWEVIQSDYMCDMDINITKVN